MKPLVLETVAGAQLTQAAEVCRELKHVAPLGPDVVVVARHGFDHAETARILAVWMSLQLSDSDCDSTFKSWVDGLVQGMHSGFPKDIVTPVLLLTGAEKHGW